MGAHCGAPSPDGNHGEINQQVKTKLNPQPLTVLASPSIFRRWLCRILTTFQRSRGVKGRDHHGRSLDALPELLARADGLKKRHVELAQGKPRK